MISLILPSLNRQQYVNVLLHDLEKQTFKDFELVIIDQSVEKYKLPQTSYPINHISSDAKGPCNAKNVGGRAAKGDVYLFIDDDVRIDCDFVELLVRPILDGKTEVTTAAICDKDGNHSFSDFGSHLTRSPFILQNILGNPHCPGVYQANSISAGCFAMKRKDFFDLDGFDEFYDPNGASEDRDFAIRLQKNGCRMLYVGEARLAHLDAGRGGRRDVVSDKRFDVFKLNMGYTIHKHFGNEAFEYYKVQLGYFYYKKFGLLSCNFWMMARQLIKWKF